MMTESPRYGWLAAAALGLALGACRTPPPRAAPQSTAGNAPRLRSPSELPFDFIWQQHVTAKWQSKSESFDAVLQKRGDELLLMGLSPLGRPGFVLTLKATELSLRNRTGRKLPFEPRYILADVQRAFFPWLEPPPQGFSGTRSGSYEDLSISETYQTARLRSRTIRPKNAAPGQGVQIEYRGWSKGQDAPTRVELTNRSHGYRLVIETVSQQRL